MYNVITIFIQEFTLEINAYNEINSSAISTNTEATTFSSGSSLFNSLIAQNIDKKETVSSTQGSLKDRVKVAIGNLKEDISLTSQDATNTHDELTLMLALKNMQAS